MLRSVNTTIGPREDESGERADLLPPSVQHRVPRASSRTRRRDESASTRQWNVDSEHVEYLGFGHPIVDRLVHGRDRREARRSCGGRDAAGRACRSRADGLDGSSTGGIRIAGCGAKELDRSGTSSPTTASPTPELGKALLMRASRQVRPRNRLRRLRPTTPPSKTRTRRRAGNRAFEPPRRGELAALPTRGHGTDQDRRGADCGRYTHRRLQAGDDQGGGLQRHAREDARVPSEASRRAVIPLWEANLPSMRKPRSRTLERRPGAGI